MYVRDDKDLFGYSISGRYEQDETNVIKNLVKPSWVCMDIGANIGYFTILLAQRCKHVYAFEPEPGNFEMLKLNLQLNKFGDVTIYREAVGNKNGTMPLYISDENHGMHRLYKSKWCRDITDTYVYVTELDNYKFPKIDFIKMDIEGAEFGALNGMVELLIRDHPIIIMEYHPMAIKEYGADPRKVYEFMHKLNYKMSLIPNIQEPVFYEDLAVLTSDPTGGRNILCQ